MDDELGFLQESFVTLAAAVLLLWGPRSRQVLT